MRPRKNYQMATATPEVVIDIHRDAPVLPVQLGARNLDFERWRLVGGRLTGKDASEVSAVDAGRLEIVCAMRDALSRLAKTLSPNSILTIHRGAVPQWFAFLDELALQGQPIVKMSDITKELLEAYVSWLLRKPAETETGVLSYAAARAIYSQTKSVLLECVCTGILSRDCLPVNPFPGSNRSSRGHQSYSKGEMSRLLAALAADLAAIRAGAFDEAESDTLLVYLLLIAARTGRNPAPLLELRRDALQPHPLKPDSHALLTTYKRRGNNIAVQSFRRSKEIEDVATVQTDVATLYLEILALTERHVRNVPSADQARLWLCRRQPNGGWGDKVAPIDASMLKELIDRFIGRHSLLSDDVNPRTGEPLPLRVTIMRLRKTFATRIWRLTGGDLIRASTALGNQPRMTDSHYLAVTPEMERNHKFVGLCLETQLRGASEDPEVLLKLADEMRVPVDEVRRVLSGKHNTGVGRCSSPFYGKFAPKTGERVCTSFLHCFRCPNQVVMETDLHRLFSFYWLLIKERNLLGRNRWHKVYGWVIREIDRVISGRFPADIVLAARTSAQLDPHPMWRERSILGGAGND
ncbi:MULTISPECIES: hypothetical protein [Burkholderiaceae]|uniref:Phage integrase n=1 Tax=Paraburkholderia phytofirmans (strain DSM 17436 / LMG 22146 / PsJN) TaxID=398527 RepID=B2TH95_PARPJ|nr:MULTISPECIES: hypothetical protein [Burkholderiaceae]ACD21644.1 phage integrase [Paraburkholderia phytofirmans PsJN]HDR8965282.1 integrase [Burkholderia vietnamiensis]HDR8968449.1 integrase [Burkholderia vietnamiensis]